MNGPEALGQWSLELALFLAGHSQSFSAISTGPWEGVLWFGYVGERDDEFGIREGDGKLLVYLDENSTNALLQPSVERYRTGRASTHHDIGPLTVNLSGPAWLQTTGVMSRTSRRKR